VVNDGSTDAESLRVLGTLEDAGYRVLHKPNGGLSSARNAGLELARGRFVLPLDADNRLLGGFLEEALGVLRGDPTADVVYGDRRLFGGMRGELATPDFDLRALLGGNRIDACALYRRELWAELGGYDTGMSGLEDWEFWLHAARRGRRFVHLDRLAFEYRVRGASLLAESLRPRVRLRLFGRVLDRHTELFHERVPLLLRPASLLLGRLVPDRFARRLRRHECALFWHPLWLLIGSGGLVSDHREQLRAHRARG
jgi:glycosyltransferase involved in cell wall biosynthesis